MRGLAIVQRNSKARVYQSRGVRLAFFRPRLLQASPSSGVGLSQDRIPNAIQKTCWRRIRIQKFVLQLNSTTLPQPEAPSRSGAPCPCAARPPSRGAPAGAATSSSSSSKRSSGAAAAAWGAAVAAVAAAAPAAAAAAAACATAQPS
eukprot:15470969-Alexandrium_andersonii.AAC.1